MAMKYQQGTVYPRGKRVKMWYGFYTIYTRNREGKEIAKRRNVKLGPKANAPKWKAEQMLRAVILKVTGVAGEKPLPLVDESITFRRFVEERYLPMRQACWSPAYKKINTYEIQHYLVSHFGHLCLRGVGSFEIQTWLNELAKEYSDSVVRHSFINIRSITKLAKKLKFLAEDPGEGLEMPQTKLVKKPRMNKAQILSLLGGIHDLHDRCLMYIGIFCGPRASEALGLQWKSWTGTSLLPQGTAFEGVLYPERLKTDESKKPIPVPELVRPLIEVWHKACPDPSPEALMFPTFGRGERKGQAVPRWGKNFLTRRIRPVSRKLGIPDRLVTFQVMRRTMGTDLQKHGSLKDVQGALRHASIKTTGDVYVQTLDDSVLAAVDSRTAEILKDWKQPEATQVPSAPKRRRVKKTSQGRFETAPSCTKWVRRGGSK